MQRIFSIPPFLKEISGYFHQAGFSVYLVGGAVRDFLLKKPAYDFDIATNAQPHDVMKLFRRTIPTGIEHGTVTILYKNMHIECTTFRTEAAYNDGRHPSTVSYTAKIEEDLARRDFTMNAIAVSLPDGAIIDPFGGRADIKAACIKTVGAPLDRFLEDGLRPVRAIRFAAQLGFIIEENTLAAIPQTVQITKKISVERFREEFSKIIMSKNPLIGLHLLEKTGLLELFLPELTICRGIEQKGFHHFDVLEHCLLACSACPAQFLHIRLAGLFHDIGKPAVRKKDETGIYTFYRHEAVSEKLTRTIMKRLKYSNTTIEKTAHLVAQHMFHYEPSWSDAAVRRFIIRVGKENIADLFALRRADAFALAGIPVEPAFLIEFENRIDALLKESQAFSLKDLTVNGTDLLDIGIPKGKQIGIVLQFLLESVIDDPEQNTRAHLLRMADAYYKQIQVKL